MMRKPVRRTGKKPPSPAPSSASRHEQEIRLNRYIARAGVCSRREADELIKKGKITVNGKVISEMGFQVKTGDVVKLGQKQLSSEKTIYVLLNKPKDFITTTDDPQGRKTVMQLVKRAGEERIYPVGRLDRNTTGLLLLTNDGKLAEKLTHPSHKVRKIYHITLNRSLAKVDLEKILKGVKLEDGIAPVDALSIVSEDKKEVGIEIHMGRNRVIRRIFESLDYEVVKLDRVVYAGLDKKDLPRGKWRFLTQKEIVRLKHLS